MTFILGWHTMPPKKEQNINQSNGEELLPLSQARDLMSQQKDLFMQLLQQQESISRLLWNYLWTMWTLGLTNWPGRHRSWEAACNSHRRTLMNLQRKMRKFSQREQLLVLKPYQCRRNLQRWLRKRTTWRGQTRRNNLVVDGIPETHNESWKDKVRCVINDPDILERDLYGLLWSNSSDRKIKWLL